VDHDLDRFPIIPCPAPVRDAVEVRDVVEHLSRLDRAFENLREKSSA
jgi:hypothetical protein